MALTTIASVAAVVLTLLGFGHLLAAFNAPQVTRNGRPLRKPFNTLPIVGNALVFLRPRQEVFEWFTECVRRYGHETLQVIVPSLPQGVIISSPKNLDFVFKHEDVFAKGRFFKDRLQDLFGNGILNVDGELWKRQRKVGTQFLAAANLNIVATSELPALINQSVGYLHSRADGEKPVDLEEVFHELTTQLMGKMTYGIEMHANDDFTRAFDFASRKLAHRFQNPFWRLTELFTGSELRASIRTIKSKSQRWIWHVVKAGIGETGKGTTELQEVSKSFINALFDSLDNPALAADSAVNFLSAGKDTVAQALTWTFYLLIRHPDVANKVCNVNQNPFLFARDRFQSAAASYTLAVFYETLRLYPPLPMEIRETLRDITLPDGTFLPQGSIVMWCPWAMNRSELIWGSNASQFHPERWLDNGTLVQKSVAEFPVFQGGPRLCLGKKLAELIAIQVISALVPLFEFCPAYTGEKTSITHLTMPINDGLQVYVKTRSWSGILET